MKDESGIRSELAQSSDRESTLNRARFFAFILHPSSFILS
jgi:hypothetical protein